MFRCLKMATSYKLSVKFAYHPALRDPNLRCSKGGTCPVASRKPKTHAHTYSTSLQGLYERSSSSKLMSVRSSPLIMASLVSCIAELVVKNMVNSNFVQLLKPNDVHMLFDLLLHTRQHNRTLPNEQQVTPISSCKYARSHEQSLVCISPTDHYWQPLVLHSSS